MSNLGRARIVIVIVTILIPFAARIPLTLHYGQVHPGRMGVRMDPSATWFFDQYIHYNVWLWIIVLQIPTAAVLLFFGMVYRHRSSLATFAVPILAFQAYAHGTLDIAWNSTASVALIFIPIYTVALTIVTVPVGLGVDWYLERRRAAGEHQRSIGSERSG